MTRKLSLWRSQPRGATLVELSIGAVLVAAALSLTAQTLAWTAADRLEADRRLRAIQLVGNLMERLTARPWSELTPEATAGVGLPGGMERDWPDPRLRVEVADTRGGPGRRILIELSWLNRSGERSAPVRLVAFVHPREEPQP